MLAAPAVAGPIAIPPMPMADALLALAQQSGRNILFAPDMVAGLRSGAVHAADFDQALHQITGTAPFRITRGAGGAVTLRRIVPRAAPPPPRRAASRLKAPLAAPILVDGVQRWEAGPDHGDTLALQSTLGIAEARRLPDRTLAEALSRIPGVLALSTSLEGNMGGTDHAARAEGDFIALRGLHDGYIEIRMDGVALPQSLPYSRGTDLGLLPVDGFTHVAIIKMLGPALAGDANAGVVDIRDGSPRDPALQGLHVYGLGGLDQRALAYRQNGASVGGGLSWAGTVAGDRLALMLGAAVSRRAFANVEQTYQQGNVEYAITDASGRSAPGLDPARNLMLTSLNAEVTRGTSREMMVHGGFDFDASDRLTLFGRFHYANEHIAQDIFQIGFQGGRDPSYVARVPIGDGLYRTQSIKSELHYWYETNPEQTGLALGQLGAHWHDGGTDWVVRGFAATGWTGRPGHLEISFWDPVGSALDGGLQLGRRHGYPVPILSAYDAALTDRLFTFPVHDEGEDQQQHSRDTRGGGDATLRHEANGGALRAWEIGAELLAVRRAQWLRNITYSSTYPAGTTLGETGLASESISPLLGGVYGYSVPLIDDSRLASVLAQATPDPLSLDDRNADTIVAHERRFAVHGSARFAWGRWTLDAGLRLQHVRVIDRYWLAGNDGVPLDGTDYGWQASGRSFDAVLPSLMARWQPAAGLTMRAGLWASQTQPADHQLAGGASVEEQADGTEIIEQGNPHLKAVDAFNADLALEWRGARGVSLSLAGFAKRLDHYLYDMGDSYGVAADTGETSVEIVQPRNGGRADIRGLELTALWPLATLAPWLTGWSLGGEATLIDSRVHLHVPQLDPVEHAQYAPGHSGTLRLRYARGRFSADAALSFTGAYIQQYGLYGASLGTGALLDGSALDDWVRPARRLDLGIACGIGARATLRLTLRNALDDVDYRATLGRHSDAVPETIVSGRIFGLRFDRSL